MYLFELLIDAHLVLLELLHLLEDLHALAAAGVHEGVSCRAPVETLDTRLYRAIEKIQVFFEQELFFIGDSMHDSVVVSDNQHHIFTKDPKLFLLSKKFRNCMRNSDVPKRLYLSPILNFNDHLQEFGVKIALQ